MAFEALESIGAAPQAFLDVEEVTTTPSGGDGDDVLEPGDNATLLVRLVNNGGATAIRVRAVLTTTTPGVTITSGSSLYPNIGSAGGSAENTTPFTLTVAPTVTCGTVIRLRLTVTYTGRTSPRVFDINLTTGTASATPTRVDYTGPAVAIPDNTPAGASVPIVVSGFTAGVADVDFIIGGESCSSVAGSTTVGLDHTWVGDLQVTLTSPRGTTVTLMTRPGGLLNGGNNFCQTVLDDDATSSIQAITTAGAPYTGTFKPANALAAFNGEDPNGTWTVTVTDLARADIGNVRNVSLVLSQFECR
jgi:subtilisin-like proprotein convertase family protein